MDFKDQAMHLNSTTTKKTKLSSIFKGLFYALMSGVCNSFVFVIVKHMKNLHPGQLALYRFFATFVMCMPECLKAQQNLLGPRNLRIFMVLRGILGGLSIFFNFIAFRYLGLGEAGVIVCSVPVFTTIFARIFLKEPCNIFQAITVILTVLGIIFTSKLPSRLSVIPVVYGSEKILGLVSAILSLFSMSILQIFTRKVRPVHPSILTLHFSWVGGLEIAILTALFGNFQMLQCGIQSVYILLIALLGYSGITLVIMAFQCEYAGPVSTVRAATDIGLAFLWQIFIFHDMPDVYGIIGAILVVFSIVLIALDKWKSLSHGNLFFMRKI